MNQRYFIIVLLLSLISTFSIAQDRDKVLFSGVIVENDSLKPVSYANIIIVNKNLGTMSTIEGYFAFYAQEQDTIRFSAMGFEPSIYIIPEMVETERYSIIQVMGRDTLELAETIIYPWPANERDFKESFIHDEIEDDEVVSSQEKPSD